MARRRFKPDPDFELVVTAAVSGIEGTGRGRVRRRGTTLAEISEQIIDEAQRLTAQELPGYVTGGRHNPNSDFRRREREPGGGKPGRTYYSSFGYSIERRGGRLVFVVYNNHPHAQEVESGSGGVVHARGGDRYYAIPISKRKYAQLMKRARVLSPAQKDRRRDQSALAYWRRRERELRKRSRTNERLLRRRIANPNTRARISNEELIRRSRQRGAALARARDTISSLEGKIGDPRSPHSFPVVAPNGKTYLYTKSFRAYGGYGILQRAMNIVVNRELR